MFKQPLLEVIVPALHSPLTLKTPAQPGYDQSMTQLDGGYATVPIVSCYVKSVSPQPGYANYNATNKMYGAPRSNSDSTWNI
ncbi:hypothetical protein BC332_15913 [Capsicum chinense]|nr:hypothetical protein BC332_15913 [Capsicum chinense]